MGNWTDEVRGRLGFGFMRLPMRGEDIDLDETTRMVDAFMAAGFNYFDTAHVYQGGKSEIALRECLVKRYPRDSFLIADKLSTENWKRESQIDALLDAELEALGIEYFDMLLMHAQNAAASEKYERAHAYEHAAAFMAAGKARHFGISFHDTPDVLERILDEHPEIEAVQIQFNYADFENGSVQSLGCYQVCERRGIPSIVMEPLKGGNLVNLPKAAQAVIDELPNPEGLTNAGLALRFAASYPNNVVILSGMGALAQVEDNVRTMAQPDPLTPEQMEALGRIHDVFRDLGMVECTGCHYCTDGCPQRIMIPEMLGCLNTQRVFGGWSPEWYYSNSLTRGEHGRAGDCVQCGLCERACPQKLPIRDLLAEVSAEFD